MRGTREGGGFDIEFESEFEFAFEFDHSKRPKAQAPYHHHPKTPKSGLLRVLRTLAFSWLRASPFDTTTGQWSTFSPTATYLLLLVVVVVRGCCSLCTQIEAVPCVLLGLKD